MSSNTAFSQSKGIQFTQSLARQRGHGYGDPLQTWQLVIIEHFTELSLRHDPEPNAPAPIPENSLSTELLAVDWGIFNDVPQLQEFVVVYDPAASPTRFQHMYTSSAEAEFEWRVMPLQTSYPINNMFPGLPVFTHRGNPPTPYTGQGSKQCSFWKTQTGIDPVRAVWRSWTNVQRCRYKWNRPVDKGFFAVANIWWLDQFGYKYGFNPDNNAPLGFNQLGPGRISLEDVHVISEHNGVGANTWIEPPYHFDRGQPGGFTDGFAGQIMLSIDYESPADWSFRTGIPITT
jgi:hypothetical protein